MQHLIEFYQQETWRQDRMSDLQRSATKNMARNHLCKAREARLSGDAPLARHLATLAATERVNALVGAFSGYRWLASPTGNKPRGPYQT